MTKPKRTSVTVTAKISSKSKFFFIKKNVFHQNKKQATKKSISSVTMHLLIIARVAQLTGLNDGSITKSCIQTSSGQLHEFRLFPVGTGFIQLAVKRNFGPHHCADWKRIKSFRMKERGALNENSQGQMVCPCRQGKSLCTWKSLRIGSKPWIFRTCIKSSQI